MTLRLAEQHCLPQDGGSAYTPYEIKVHLAMVAGWSLVEGPPQAIEKTYRFAHWHETVAFVNALAWIAQREDHHPQLAVAYDRCAVRLDTHAVGGLSLNDFICAARFDALVT
ncbi:4a-hydroxytetrahydrobiopterin dehydratase [Methylibium sp.]|uniref:4a-hydroxytetrahydrobiopterin dehydratase n=1 Tax=Methylibium sp. TaxID=2067992 RepID=UPI0039C8F828